MDKAIKARWVAALRSGKYKQGAGVLHNVDKNTFCCLGVLCEITAEELGMNKNTIAEVEEGVYCSDHCAEYNGNRYTLPDILEPIVGSDNPTLQVPNCGELLDPGEKSATRAIGIASLNDYFSFDFNKLADLIEEQL